MLLKNPVFRRLILIVVSMAVAGYSTYVYREYLRKNSPRENVLVARRDIPAYSIISPDDLGYATLPAGSRLPETIQDPKSAVGKRAVAAIYQGEQVLPQKLVDGNLALQPGERKVGIPVDPTRAVGMTVRPGDHVDAYWLPSGKNPGLPEREGEATVRQAQLVAEDAVVWELITREGTGITSLTPGPEEKRATTVGGKVVVAVVKVRASEVQGIITAIGNGDVFLATRRPQAEAGGP